jgi:magnesium-transporting ATPase (P-type)
MLQVFNLINIRFFRQKLSFKQFFANKLFLLVVILIVGGQVLIGQIGGSFFRTTQISLYNWLIIIALSGTIFILMRLASTIFGKKINKFTKN